jgi:hypothetical protein
MLSTHFWGVFFLFLFSSFYKHARYANAYDHASPSDDLDDFQPFSTASVEFQSGRTQYDKLVRDMLVVWDGVVGVAVGLWVALRISHVRALRALRFEVDVAARAEGLDTWRDTRQSAWSARRALLEAQREAFNEVAKPLEPYVFVFVVFAAPAFVMSTSFCQKHSGASATYVSNNGYVSAAADYSYGTCDVWCELVLAFRSLGAVAVYLVSRERRAEIVDVGATWRKLRARVIGCIRCKPPPPPYALLGPDDGDWHEMQAIAQQTRGDRDNSDITAVAADAASLWRISEGDITMVRLLGEGAFGAVWEATLLPDGLRVAVKVLFAGTMDQDGDMIDVNADDEFRKECAALQRIDNPHLLKFFGFGTTANGNGFIVTELVSGGSLEDLLHNPQRDLPWRTRITIGLQVALGMEHLHQRHMLHRDLKSANVLLDEHLKAKVCDFGLSRVARPARRQVVHSSFTGVTRLLPRADGIELQFLLGAMAQLPTSATVADARDKMTKAAGTLLWMAPEVFRGDQDYTSAVDVYSFGMVMWELATRKTPWIDDLPSDPAAFFEELNRCLQTGRRPSIPVAVLTEHDAFVALMQRCWAGDPVNRPTFAEAVACLAACLRLVE